MKNTLLFSFIILLCFVTSFVCSGQTTSLVSIDNQGNLTYTADTNGNVVPDFSMVGYHQGEKKIPTVPIKITLNPGSGDRRSDIQNAINTLAAMSPDTNGHRGTILLTKGFYAVSDVLNIRTSGIVIRGEGKGMDGTIVELTATTQTNLFDFRGAANANDVSSTRKIIVGAYVPIGTKVVTVASGHTFQADDRVLLVHSSSPAWVSLLGMDQLESICGDGHSNWSPTSVSNYKRRVKNVSGNQITLDAPVVDPIDANYTSAALVKYTWDNKIEECGIENMRLQSAFASDTDENHGWRAVSFRNIENAWARNINGFYFGFSCLGALNGAYQITFEDCGMFEYKSQITGGRRYGFNTDDSDLVLVKNCVASQGRHDFVQGSRTPGPNVYTNCSSTETNSDHGPHHRWSTGTLWDVISSDNSINAQNRLCSGSGHGWAGVQQMFWNCTAPKMVLHDPPADYTNWAIGCTASITNQGNFNGVTEPLGFVESQNIQIAAIPSLYEAQLRDRLAPNPPSDLKAAAMNNQINLVWNDNSTDEDEFVIERSENSSTWATIALTTVDATTYADTSASPSIIYNYRVRSARGTATSIASNEASNILVGIEAIYSTQEIILYPNPTKSFLNIITKGNSNVSNIDDLIIKVYNINGAELIKYKGINRIDVTSLPSGTYFLTIENTGSGRKVARFIKE